MDTHDIGKRAAAALALILPVLLLLLLSSASLLFVARDAGAQPSPTNDDWPTSLHDVERTAASNDTNMTATAAPTLTKLWTFQTGGPVATTPDVVDGTAYFGSWDGYEYAVNATTGALVWKTYLGLTDAPSNCTPSGEIGISSPATVSNGVVYVGGGDGYFYALNATTGAVDWRTWVEGSNTPGNYDGHYNWSGPLIVNGYAYVGVASFGDCPLIQGQLIQISLSNGAIYNTLNLVPNGQVGGGIWTSPAYDPSTNTIFTNTGTQNQPTQQWAQAYLAVNASTLEVEDSWKLPLSEEVEDSDFGTSTTLFTDSAGDPLVASINKNGEAYAFNRNNLAAGPIWTQQIAIGGDCPTCGESSVSSGAFGDGTLFMAGNTGVINGVGYPGTVRALNPSNGDFIWQHGAPGSVIGALAYDNGMVFDGGGDYLEVLDATTGQRLYSYDTGSQIYAGASIADGIVYVGNTAGQVDAFSEPASPPPPPPPDQNCPSGFTCQDIGSPSPAGSETVTSGSWSISAGGAGVSGTSDSFRLMSEPTDGDAQVSTLVQSAPTGAGGQAGVMIRQSNDPDSPYYAVLAEPGNTLAVRYRTAYGGPTTVATTTSDGGSPLYVLIQRVGDSFQAATSTDGSDYTLVPGSDIGIPLPAVSLAGLAVSSGTQGVAATATISDVSIGIPSITLVPPTSSAPCPSGWTCQDIGNPALVGSQSYNDSSGIWTVQGAGTGIGQTATTSYSEWPIDDQFHYVSQSLTGDGTISAQVTSQTDTSGNDQAGVMMRAGTTGGAAYYGTWITPDNGVVVDFRTTAGIIDDEVATVAGTTPAWLEVARSGDTFTAYTSPDGVNWTPVVGSSETLPNLDGTILAGLVVSSEDPGALSTATFAGVNIADSAPTPPDLCPSGWSCNDIGFPTPSGNQSYDASTGTWTVQAGGGDITDPEDQFRLMSEDQETDGVVSAQVVSQSDTSPWAKSGVMIRTTTSDTAAYYGVFVTPGNGIAVQYRPVEGGVTSYIETGTGSAPTYLEIGRSGDSYTAYTSPDGVNWTAVAGSTESIPALTGTLQAGLAVCSHNALALNTTVFDDVNITGTTGTGGLPSLWTDQDIGGATPAGSATYQLDTFTVNGGGGDIWGTADQFNYASQPTSGDLNIVAQVTSQTDTDPWAKAGVMIKQSATAGSPYALVAVTPGNGIVFQWGFDSSVSATVTESLPNAWLRLERQGDVFTAYESSDGFNWVPIDQVEISMTASATAGLVVCSHNTSELGTATFQNVTLTPEDGGPLPSPWVSTDIGSPEVPGESTWANGEYYVSGSGSDIWNTDGVIADEFQYAYQPLNSNGTIVAQVTSQTATDPWAKAGIMIKQSATADAPYALVAVTPGNEIDMQYGFDATIPGGDYAFPNAWLKLTRSGNTFTAYESSDGSTWMEVGSTTLSMSATATAGLFVCSHNPNQLGTATFQNVSVTSNFDATAASFAPMENVPTGPVVAANITNANDDTGTYSATVDYGDGTATQAAAVNVSGSTGAVTAPSHTYATTGTFTMTTTVTNSDGFTQTVSEPITVTGPTITGFSKTTIDRGGKLSTVVSGTGFDSSADHPSAWAVSGSGVTVVSAKAGKVTKKNPNPTIDLRLSASMKAVAGEYDVTLTQDNGRFTFNDAIKVIS